MSKEIQIIDPGVNFGTAPVKLLSEQLAMRDVPIKVEHGLQLGREINLITLRNPIPNIHALVGRMVEEGIPVHYSERQNKDPIFIAGGTAATNPFSLTFIDATWIGDITAGTFDAIQKASELSSRDDRLDTFKKAGFYVPIVGDSEKPIRHKVLKPLTGVVVDTGIISLSRPEKTAFVQVQSGCGLGCAFCFDGQNRKYTLSQEDFEQIALSIIENNPDIVSFRLSFPSLKEPEFLGFTGVLKFMKERFQRDFLIDIGSINPDQFSFEVAKSMVDLGHRSITFAPEVAAGLVDGIDLRKENKPWFTDEFLFQAIENGVAAGVEEVILYHMTGFPGETLSHLDAYVDLVRQIQNEFPGLKLGITSGILYPLPFTRLENIPQIQFPEVMRRWKYFKEKIDALGIGTYWLLEPGQRFRSSQFPVTAALTYTQTFFHRGDANIGKSLANYWQSCSTSEECLNLPVYKLEEVLAQDGIDLEEFYTGQSVITRNDFNTVTHQTIYN